MGMPRLGMGTWHMGDSKVLRGDEVAAQRLGLDLGIERAFPPPRRKAALQMI